MPHYADRFRPEPARDAPRPSQRCGAGTAAPHSPQDRANRSDRTVQRSVQVERVNAPLAAKTGVQPEVVQREVRLSTAPWGPSKGKWITTLDTSRHFDTEEEARSHEAQVLIVRRTEARRARRARVTPEQMPETHVGKQTRFPGVVASADDTPADLVYRGMSINNVRNLQRGGDAVFTSQAPDGGATPLQHVVDDSEASPYLSFEGGGLDVSAGKYAPKPVDPVSNKPLGVTPRPGDFLKQEKSYTNQSRIDHPHAKRIGYVGGITHDAGSERLDVSDDAKARAVFDSTPGESQERRETAINLAKADREVLVKPGRDGIAPAKVPFVSKVKEVDEAYYSKHVARQTPRKALGYYKSYGAAPAYVKLQIPDTHPQYKFGIHADLRRDEDDSESEMSDIEDIDLSDYP